MSETIAQIKKECEEEFKKWIEDMDCDDTHLEDYYGDDSRKLHFYDGYNRAKLKYKQQLKQRDELIKEVDGQNKKLVDELQILRRAYNNICDDLELGEHIDFDWIKESILEQPESITISSLNTKVAVLSSKLKQKDELIREACTFIEVADKDFRIELGSRLKPFEGRTTYRDFLNKEEIQAIINKEKV